MHGSDEWLIDVLIDQAKEQLKRKLEVYASEQADIILFDLISKIEIASKVDASGEKIIEVRFKPKNKDHAQA